VEGRFHELPTSDVTTSTAGKKRVMTNDAEAQQVRATATSPGPRQEPMADDPAEPSGLVGEEDMADPDAVIIEEDAIAEEGPAGTARPTTSGAAAAGATRANAIPEAARPVPAQGNGGGLGGGDPERMHERWATIQSTFVDDPRGAVAAAADLVTEAIAALVASAQERERGLRGEWDRDGADTEDLRNTLRSYRGLLDELVTR
jgi:hypothetical protein